MTLRVFSNLTCLFASFLLWFNLSAQTNYQGPQNGSWSTAANWTNGLPAPGNNAVIGGGSNTPIIDQALTIDFKITSFDTILVQAAVTNQNTIENSGVLEFSAAGSFTNQGVFQNFGTTNVLPSATFTNDAGGSVNNSLGTITISTTLVNRGDFINQGTLNANNGTIQTSGTFDNRRILNTNMLKIEAGTTFLNNFGAELNLVGAGAILDIDGEMTNNGALSSLGNTNVRGLLTNNVSITNNATANFTVFEGGTVTSNGTILNQGTWTSAGTITNTGNFFNENIASSTGVFTNNNRLENRVGATFTHDGSATLNMGFGSVIQNNGTFISEKQIDSFGAIINDGTFTNNDKIVSNSGGRLENNSNFTNNGRIDAIAPIMNNGMFFNPGFVSINSGSILTNTGVFTNEPTGTVVNFFEIDNKAGATFTNNGRLDNQIRFFTEGSFTNNGYFSNAGDLFIRTTGMYMNAALMDQLAGNIMNEGQLNNTGQLLNDDCSTIHNKATLNNSGSLTNKGIVFQRGTLNGTIISVGGYVHTDPTSNAPSVCLDQDFSADGDGVVKVYGTALVAFENFDSCQTIIYTANGQPRPTFACSDIGTIQNVQVKMLTRLGDSLTCVSMVNPTDELAPIFTDCPGDQLFYTASDSIQATWVEPTAIDNCSAVTMTQDAIPNDFFPIGINGVVYSATDAYGNEQFCQFRVAVIKLPATAAGSCSGDVTGPAMVCPTNIVTSTTNAATAAIWQEPSVTDQCLPILLTADRRSGEFFVPGTHSVTYTAEDGSGNTSTCSFSITVNSINVCATDNTNPVITNCPSTLVVAPIGNLNGAFVSWPSPNAFDNCALASFGATKDPNSFFPLGTNTVTYTAIDGSNNQTTCSFNIIVGASPCANDQTGPVVLNCPTERVVNTSDLFAPATWTAPTFTDACGPVVVNASHTSGSLFRAGNTEVIYKASDQNGNTTECAFNVAIVNPCAPDATAPVVQNCPADITVQSPNGQNAMVSWTAPTAMDACSPVVFQSSYTPGVTFPLGLTQVVYTAIDVAGNFTPCVFLVNVVGQTACTTNASPINAAVDVDPTSTVLTWNETQDALNYDVFLGTTNPPTSLVASNVVGVTTTLTNLQEGTQYFWYVVPKNAAGGATGCATSITSFTTSATGVLTIACPQNIVETALQGETSKVVTYADPTANSTCPIGAVELGRIAGLATGDAFPIGTNTIVYRATDGCSNTTTCSFTVLVNAAPTGALTLNCPANITVTAAQGATTATANYTAPQGTSTCPTGTVTTTRMSGMASGSAFPVGTNTVVYRATDGCSNTTTCSFTVLVNAAPTGTPNCDAITYDGSGGKITIRNLTAPNVGIQIFNGSFTTTLESCFNPSCYVPQFVSKTLAPGVYYAKVDFYTASWALICSDLKAITVVAGSGNTGVLTLTCPQNQNIQTASNATTVIANYATPTASSTCAGGVSALARTSGLASGSAFPIGLNTVIYQASDNCANQKTCSFTINVTQTLSSAITINCPANQTVTATANATTASVNYNTPSATTTCTQGGVSLSRISGLQSGSSFPIGTSTVTYQAVDPCGSVKSCSFTVTVQAGTTGGGNPTDCSGVTYNGTGGQLTVGGLTASHVAVQIFDPSWKLISTCFDTDCTKPTVSLPNLAPGTYNVKVDFYGANWALICSTQKAVPVTTGGGGNTSNLTMTCPASISQTVPATQNSAVVTYAQPNVTTTCAGSNFTLVRTSGQASGTVFPIGTSTVAYRATDVCSNEKTCSFTVTVNQASSGEILINCPQNITVNAVGSATSASVMYQTPTATTTCNLGGVSLSRTAGLQSGSSFPIGTTTVSYQGIDPCGNVKMCTFTVTVNAGSTGSGCTVQVSFSEDISCNSPQGLLTANATGGSGSYTYNWSSGQQGQSIWTNPGTYTVTVSAGNNCTKVATGTLVSGVSIQTNLTANGNTASVNPTGGQAPYQASWTNGSGYNVWGPLSVTNLPIGNYTVKVYDANWCATERLFSVTSNKIAQAESVTLAAKAEHGTVALNWVFRANQKATNIIVERRESPSGNAEILFDLLDNADANEMRYFSEKDETPLAGTAFYRVSAYLEDGTHLVSAWKEVEMPVFEEVLVYPNPASGAVHLAVNGSIDQATWVRITNQYGQIMLEQEIAIFGRFQTIDLGDVPSGMYFIQMQAEGQRPVVRRLIVETGK